MAFANVDYSVLNNMSGMMRGMGALDPSDPSQMALIAQGQAIDAAFSAGVNNTPYADVVNMRSEADGLISQGFQFSPAATASMQRWDAYVPRLAKAVSQPGAQTQMIVSGGGTAPRQMTAAGFTLPAGMPGTVQPVVKQGGTAPTGAGAGTSSFTMPSPTTLAVIALAAGALWKFGPALSGRRSRRR